MMLVRTMLRRILLNVLDNVIQKSRFIMFKFKVLISKFDF
jgi:hypothetical protein